MLTKREKEILHLMSKGFTNRQIAVNLNISFHTVKAHIENIFDKLKAKNRIQAVMVYYESKQ